MNLNEASTHRGLIWFAAASLAVICIFLNERQLASDIFYAGAMLAGLNGIFAKDTVKEDGES